MVLHVAIYLLLTLLVVVIEHPTLRGAVHRLARDLLVSTAPICLYLSGHGIGLALLALGLCVILLAIADMTAEGD